jgi:hypothetical protein
MSPEIEVLPLCFFRSAVSSAAGPWINLFWESAEERESTKRVQSDGAVLSLQWVGGQPIDVSKSLYVALGLAQELIVLNRQMKVQSTVQQLVENICESTGLSMAVKRNETGRHLEFSKLIQDNSTGMLPSLSRGSCFLLECQSVEDASTCRQLLTHENVEIMGVRRTSMEMPLWRVDTEVLLSSCLEFIF